AAAAAAISDSANTADTDHHRVASYPHHHHGSASATDLALKRLQLSNDPAELKKLSADAFIQAEKVKVFLPDPHHNVLTRCPPSPGSKNRRSSSSNVFTPQSSSRKRSTFSASFSNPRQISPATTSSSPRKTTDPTRIPSPPRTSAERPLPPTTWNGLRPRATRAPTRR
ncbi:hypothetical protein DFJ73DRAFT_885058, partial [Zopfochytrium polystomum]